ncbi:MAG: hypothetical protein ACLUEV_06055 [Alistipes sp.]
MKKLISFSALCLTIVLSVQSVSAQGTTTLIMKDGTQQEGYLRSPFYSTIQYVDLSQSPTAKPRRYPIGEIDRIVMVGLDGDTVNYVREIRYRMFKSNSPDTKKEKGRYRMPVLFREDYRGKDGIALLTEFRETEQTTGLRTALQKERWCYVKLKDEPAARVLSVSTAGEPRKHAENFVRFAKQTFANYPDLVQRIESNEFRSSDPLKLVKGLRGDRDIPTRPSLLPLPNGRRKDKTKESVRRLKNWPSV